MTSVRDLHVWSITSGMVALSAHVQVAAANPLGHAVLAELRARRHERFGIAHCTIQVENDGLCGGRPATRPLLKANACLLGRPRPIVPATALHRPGG